MSIRPPLILACLFATAFAVGASSADTTLDRQLREAETEAPQEVQFHVLKVHGRLSQFVAKTRHVEKIAGWQQIRASGDAAYAVWDNLRKDLVWRGGKFEVIFEIATNGRLKAASVTFDGETRRVEE